jgi:hypothetical protein
VKSCAKLLVAISLAVGVAAVGALPAALAAEQEGVKDVRDIENHTGVATPAEIAAATAIKPYLHGASVTEPDLCVTEDGAPITSITTERDFGAVEGNGLRISPGGYDIADLVPGRDYRLCLVVKNYSPEPATIAIDDVDLRASDSADAGIDLIDQTSGVGSWVVPATRTFVAEKGTSYKIPYILRVPDKLPAGTIVGGVRAVRQAIDQPVQAAVTQRLYISSPGGSRGSLKIEDVSSNRLITGKPGKAALNVHYTMRNVSDYLNGIKGALEISGLGRTVAKRKTPPTTLLPDETQRVDLREDGLPWIGVYRPTLRFETSTGVVEKKLPLVWVLPPWPFVVALLLAIIVPLFILARRWWENRQDWQQYLDEDFDEDEYDDLDAQAY